jgi:cephalosporin hydroxylase
MSLSSLLERLGIRQAAHASLAPTGTTYAPIAHLPPLTPADRDVVDAFTRLVWSRWTHGRPGGEGPLSLGWLGHLVQKSPLDLWVYQELLVETMPDVVIETGTCFGGSALYVASICDLLARGRVISIDTVVREGRPAHPRLTYITGSSVEPAVVSAVASAILPGERVMVILDSDHTRDHVLDELAAYADLVTPGCYLIVEDTIVSGNPVEASFGPGPMDAVDQFLRARSDFQVDPVRERFLLTLNRNGYLRRTC